MEIITDEAITLVNTYYSEAYNYLQEIEASKANLSDVIEAASAGSKLDKKFIRSYFKKKFTGKLKETSKEAEVLEILSGTTEE